MSSASLGHRITGMSVLCMGTEPVPASGVVDQEQWHPLLAALEFQGWSWRHGRGSSYSNFSPLCVANTQLAKSYPLEGGLPSYACALAPGGE